MKGKRILVSMLTVLSMIFITSTVVGADQTEKLIKILIEKGVITSEEAQSLEKEIRGEHLERRPKKKQHPVTSGPRRSRWAIKAAPISKHLTTDFL